MIVFVHGVPETADIWDKVRAALDAPSVALSMPGFGCPRPEGFAATKEAYVEWLTSELAAIAQPVDLVGHDWGAGLTYRVAMAHSGLVRSWTADVANVLHPQYEWHDFAKIWQTEGAGEDFIRQQDEATAEQRAPVFEAMGVPAGDALAMAAAGDLTMGGCILDLYRSATPNLYAHWGPDIADTAAPGLVIHPIHDPFAHEAQAEEMAKRLGARFERLAAGHWWPYQAPEAGAALLRDFHASLG